MKKNCKINDDISIMISEESVFFNYFDGKNLAVSELMVFFEDITLDYINMSDNETLKKQILELLPTLNNIYFFNRLNVPRPMRGKGISHKLLESTLNYMLENNGLIINVVNNYGDMGKENLIKLYEKSGFRLLHEQGLMIYHKDLVQNKIEKKNKNKL